MAVSYDRAWQKIFRLWMDSRDFGELQSPDYDSLVLRFDDPDKNVLERGPLVGLIQDIESLKEAMLNVGRDLPDYGAYSRTADPMRAQLDMVKPVYRRLLDFKYREAETKKAAQRAADQAAYEANVAQIDAEIAAANAAREATRGGTPTTMDYVTTGTSTPSTPSISTGTPTQRRPQQQTGKKRGMPSLSKPSVKKTPVQKADNTPLLIGGIAIVVLAALFFAFRSKEQ